MTNPTSSSGMTDELHRFLASSAMLVNVWRAFGHDGIVAYAAKIRGADPIPPLRTEQYERAKAAMEHWSYQPD